MVVDIVANFPSGRRKWLWMLLATCKVDDEVVVDVIDKDQTTWWGFHH